MDIYDHQHHNRFAKCWCDMSYKINITLEFRTRPTKAEVENKLFDLIRDGFTLKTKEEHEREKRLVAKGRKSLPGF